MPHRRLSSAGTCEVVALPDELPCPQRGFGERPRLCGTHRKEYGRLTAEYKATSEQADGLYALVRAQDWSDEALWNLADVAAATDTASRCVEVINREIRERQEHHRRFFVELHDGHEAWIKRLRKKLRDVEDVLAQLRQCKTALINDQKLRAEEQRLAEERRKSEATRRAQLKSAWTKQEPVYSPGTYQCSCCSSPDTRYTRPRATRVVCIAYHADNSFYGSSRCTKEGLYSTLRCQEHDEEHKRSLSALRTVEDKYDSMSMTVYYIRQRSIHTLCQVTQDIADLTHYLSLADNITTLSEKLARLDGYSKATATYRNADMWPWGLSRAVVQSIRTKLEGTRSELLRPKPVATPQKPAAATTPQYRSSTQDPYRETPRATPPQSPSHDEGGGWVGTILTAAAVGIAALFGFGRR